MKPCHRHHPEPVAGCRHCWLYEHDERYRKLWGGSTPARPATVKAPSGRQRKAPCVHLGPPTGATVECPTCSGSVRLKVFACDVYGTCVLSAKPAGVRSCVGCAEYAPP